MVLSILSEQRPKGVDEKIRDTVNWRRVVGGSGEDGELERRLFAWTQGSG